MKGRISTGKNKILEGITDMCLYPSVHDKTLNRGFIFVEFKDHRATAMARRKFKNIVDTNTNDAFDISSIHTIALQNFIRGKFSVTCHFNRLRAANGLTFICKVSIYDHIYLYLFLFPEHIFSSFWLSIICFLHFLR